MKVSKKFVRTTDEHGNIEMKMEGSLNDIAPEKFVPVPVKSGNLVVKKLIHFVLK